MPMQRERYPSNWEEIALKIKTEANWQCENCGRKCKKVGESWEEFEVRTGQKITEKRMRFVLTVAHLNHIPEDCRPENLKSWCSVCHCRYDLKAIEHKKMLKREYNGQLRLF